MAHQVSYSDKDMASTNSHHAGILAVPDTSSRQKLDNVPSLRDNDGTSEDESEFPCIFCYYSAKTARGLKLHMSFKHEEERESVQCPHCEEVFESVQRLEIHSPICASIHEFRCTMCKHSFKSSKGLKIHISQKHSVKCPHCDKMCESPQLLDEHIEKCPHFRAFQCDFCTYTFKSDKGLKSHMSRKHSDQLHNVKCPHCQAFFEHARLLDIHMRVYHGKNFSCLKCKEQFASARILHQHIEDAHSNPSCVYCGIEFEHKKLMMIHMNAHHKDKLLSDNGVDNQNNDKSMIKETELKKMKMYEVSQNDLSADEFEDTSSLTTVINYKASAFKSLPISPNASSVVSVSIIPTQPHREPTLLAKPVCSILKGTSTPPKTSSPKAVTFSQDTKTMTIPPAPSLSVSTELHGISVPVITSSHTVKSAMGNSVVNADNPDANMSASKDKQRLSINCPQCRQKFSNPDLFKMHFQVYHKVPTCEVCGLKFDHVNLMRIHYNYCHNTENDLLYCHHCSKRFLTKKEFLDHLVKHHNSETGPELLGKEPEAKSDEDSDTDGVEKLIPEVDVVIKIEAGEDILQETNYEDESLQTDLPSSLLTESGPSHSGDESIHNEDGTNKAMPILTPHCPECNMEFEHVNLVKIHLKSYHNSEGLSMRCHNCSMSFTSRNKYLDHLIAFQNNNGRCDVQSKTFVTKAKLKNAIVSKTNNSKPAKAEPKKRGRKPKVKKTEQLVNGNDTIASTAILDKESDFVSCDPAPSVTTVDMHIADLATKAAPPRRRRRSIAKIAQQKKARMQPSGTSTVKRVRKRSSGSVSSQGKKKAKCSDVDSEGDDCNLKCKHCGVKFEHANLLKIHIKAHHNSTTQMLSCNRCGEKFFNKSEYLNHLIMHGAESAAEEADMDYALGTSFRKNKDKQNLEEGINATENEEENSTSISNFLAGAISDSDEDETTKTDEDLCRVTKLIENATSNFADVLRPFDSFGADEILIEQPRQRGRKKIILQPDQKYPCHHCDQVFEHSKLLTIHTKAYHNTGSSLVCYNCDLVFQDKQVFLDHIISHANDKYYQPSGTGKNIPNDSFTDQENVQDSSAMSYPASSDDDDDTSTESDENDNDDRLEEDGDVEEMDIALNNDSSLPERMPCPICGKSFPSRRRLEVHMFNHAATNEAGRYLCSVCSKAFENPRKLETHFRSHSGYKPYVCSECGKSFAYHSSYHYHKLTHSEDRPCKCPLCGKGFIQTRYLRSHMRSHKVQSLDKTVNNLVEPGRKVSVVKSGENRNSLKKYEDSRTQPDSNDVSESLAGTSIQVDTAESNDDTHQVVKQEPCEDEELLEEQLTEKLTCAICNEVFKNNEDLQSHIVCHMGERPYQCRYCTKSFTAYSSWYIHTRTHTGNKPHVCQYCGKRFLHPTGLKRHVRYHTGERPYSCTHCSSAFADSGALVSHMRSHTKSKPFQCKECGRSYTQRSSLKFHMQTHHVLSIIGGKEESSEAEGSSNCFTTVIVQSNENLHDHDGDNEGSD